MSKLLVGTMIYYPGQVKKVSGSRDDVLFQVGNINPSNAQPFYSPQLRVKYGPILVLVLVLSLEKLALISLALSKSN